MNKPLRNPLDLSMGSVKQEERQAWLDEMNGVKKNNCGSSHAELL